jgi:hypothetical protein
MAITSDLLQLAASNPASLPTVMPRPFASATCAPPDDNSIGEQLATWARTPIGLAFLLTAGTLLGLVLMKLLALLGWAMDWSCLCDNPILRSGSDNCPSPAACVIAAVGAGGGSAGKHWGTGGRGPRGTGGKSPGGGGGGTGGKAPGGGGGPSGGGGTDGKPSGPPTGPDPNWTPRDPGTDPVTGTPDLSQPQNPDTIDFGDPADSRPYGPWTDGVSPTFHEPPDPQPDPNNPQQALSDMSGYGPPPANSPFNNNQGGSPTPQPPPPPPPSPTPFTPDTITQWLSGWFK